MSTRIPVSAPFTACVWLHCCNVGQRVRAGDDVVIIEAMKMEYPVASPVTGTIVWIAESGELVEQGHAVALVEPEGSGG